LADNWTFVGVIDTDGFHTAELREMKGKDFQQVLLFADDFSIGVSTGPTPSTRQECDIQMSQLIYIDGEEVIANVLRITNPTPDPLSLELKIWLGLAGTTLPVLNLVLTAVWYCLPVSMWIWILCPCLSLTLGCHSAPMNSAAACSTRSPGGC